MVHWRWAWLVALPLGGLTFGPAGPAGAGDAAPAPGWLDLSIRGRVLGLVPDATLTGGLGLEPARAPTGAGTSRMPQAPSGGQPGIYLGVVVCEPDGTLRLYQARADDPGTLPEGPIRDGSPGPRTLFLPGRPTP